MPVETKSVKGRRELRFSSLDAVLADAEALVASPHTRMLGNWSLDRLLVHLSIAINGSLDGVSFEVPWYARLVGSFLKRRLLGKFKPGFQLPKSLEADFYPAAPSPRDALETLRAAVARTRHQQMTAKHPILGKLTHDEWTQLHCRHAELHLSFAVVD
jgi:Protein of unknown function (DUF1569)